MGGGSLLHSTGASRDIPAPLPCPHDRCTDAPVDPAGGLHPGAGLGLPSGSPLGRGRVPSAHRRGTGPALPARAPRTSATARSGIGHAMGRGATRPRVPGGLRAAAQSVHAGDMGARPGGRGAVGHDRESLVAASERVRLRGLPPGGHRAAGWPAAGLRTAGRSGAGTHLGTDRLRAPRCAHRRDPPRAGRGQPDLQPRPADAGVRGADGLFPAGCGHRAGGDTGAGRGDGPRADGGGRGPPAERPGDHAGRAGGATAVGAGSLQAGGVARRHLRCTGHAGPEDGALGGRAGGDRLAAAHAHPRSPERHRAAHDGRRRHRPPRPAGRGAARARGRGAHPEGGGRLPSHRQPVRQHGAEVVRLHARARGHGLAHRHHAAHLRGRG